MKVTVSWAWSREHGISGHWLGASSATPLIGTTIPICGTVNVCEASSGEMFFTVFPSSCMVPPTVPCTWERNGLRRPLSPSKLRTVILDQGMGGHVEGRGVLPLIPLAHEIGDPGRVSAELSDRGSGAQRQLRLGRPGLLRRDRSRSAHELVDVEPDRERDDDNPKDDGQPTRNEGAHYNKLSFPVALSPRTAPSRAARLGNLYLRYDVVKKLRLLLFVRLRRLPGPLARISPSGGSGTPRGPAGRSGPGRWSPPPPPGPLPSSPCPASKRRTQRTRPRRNTALPTTDRRRIGSVSSIETAAERDATVLTTSRVALPQSTRRARPTGFDPVTFGFVDCRGSSVRIRPVTRRRRSPPCLYARSVGHVVRSLSGRAPGA